MKNKNSGYVGNRMSKNAYHAHKMGQFPLSKIDASMLRESGFEYSVEFFKWLCEKGYIKPVAFHHTSAAANMTRFYSPRTITYVSEKYNLSLLYNLYLGNINKNDAKRQLEIKFVKVKIPSSLLNIKSSSIITIDAVKFHDYYFISKEKWICPNDNQIIILQEWDIEPRNGQWKNDNKDFIIRKILIFKDLDDILK